MKLIIGSTLIIALFACGGNKTVTESKTEMIAEYGEEKVNERTAVSTNDMLNKFNPKEEEQEFTFKGEITEVCQSAGCWVNVKKPNGEVFMVRFRDHFGIPKDTKKGTSAFFHGLAYMDTVEVADLKHYAEDAGKSKEEIAKITKDEIRFEFEADGIRFHDIKSLRNESEK